jgi:hypothetical protein
MKGVGTDLTDDLLAASKTRWKPILQPEIRLFWTKTKHRLRRRKEKTSMNLFTTQLPAGAVQGPDRRK